MLDSEILTKAKELLTPDTWTKGAFVKDKDGNSLYAYCDESCTFCAMGAIGFIATPRSVVGLHGKAKMPARFLSSACHQIHSTSPYAFNDRTDTTLEQIHELFDKAIELAVAHESATASANTEANTQCIGG